MKRVAVQLIGNVSYHASRSFVIELPDDVNVQTLGQQFLEEKADEARIAWNFSNEGLVQATDFVVEELKPMPDDLPVGMVVGESGE